MNRVHIPRATPAKARQAAEKLDELIQRLRLMEDFPAEERSREASERRRAQAQESFAFFARTYLPELIEGEGCALHGALAATCQSLGDGQTATPVDPGPFGEVVPPERERKSAAITSAVLAAPRGHAKSTWGTFAFTLWVALTGRKSWIQLVSDTEGQAMSYVDAIRTAMDESPRIRTDFGDIRTEGPAGTIILEVPQLPGGAKPAHRLARIQGFGCGQKLRGRNFQGRRPDLVVLDDVENDEAVENPARRKKLRGWLIKAVLPALDPKRGSFLTLGTILHDDSLLWSLLRMFGGAIWRCWDEDEQPLWPERFPEDHLQWLRDTMDAEDPGSFSQEMENRAQGDDEKPFKAFQTYDQLPERLNIVTHVDPATGKRRGDFTAVVTAGFAGNVCYVLDAVIKKIGPTETGRAILAAKETYGGRIQAESVAYQEALGDIVDLLAEQEGVFITVHQVTPKGDKTARIESMAPAVETGRILFPGDRCRGNGSIEPMAHGGRSGIRKLQEQLLQFPKAAHDDGPDALQGATGGRFKKKPFGGAGLGHRSGVIA